MSPLCFPCFNLYKLSKACKGCHFEIVFRNNKRIIRVKEVVESVGWFDSCIGRDRLTTAPSYQMPVCCLLLNRTAFGFADMGLLKFHVFPSPECYNSCLGQWSHLKIQPCCESIKSEGCRCPKLAAMVHLQWHLKKVENVTYVRIIPIWRQLWKHTFAISTTRPVHQIGHSSPFTQSEPGIQRQWREVESSSQEWSSISFCPAPCPGEILRSQLILKYW